MSKLLYCNNCKVYTLDKTCSKCKEKTISKNPPRFSPQDHYGKYRRELKKLQNGEQNEKNGLCHCKICHKKA